MMNSKRHAENTGGSSASAQTIERRPVAMLMEEMKQDTHEVPEGVHTKIVADHINCGDWLAVIYDKNWWLAKVITMDTHHQDVKVEFFHPHGPSTVSSKMRSKGCVIHSIPKDPDEAD